MKRLLQLGFGALIATSAAWAEDPIDESNAIDAQVDIIAYYDQPTGGTDYFMQIGSRFHTVKDCTNDQIFSIVNRDITPLPQKTAESIAAAPNGPVQRADLSCDAWTLPSHQNGMLDQSIYVDGTDYYFTTGNTGEYYKYDALTATCLSEVTGKLFSFDARFFNHVYSKPSDYDSSEIIKLTCGSVMDNPYDLNLAVYRGVGGFKAVLAVGFNRIEEGIPTTRYLPISKVDGVALNASNLGLLEAELRNVFGIPTSVYRKNISVNTLMNDIWLDYCIDMCDDANAAQHEYFTNTWVSESNATVTNLVKTDGTDYQIWQTAKPVIFEGCEADVLPALKLTQTNSTVSWFERQFREIANMAPPSNVKTFVCPTALIEKTCEKTLNQTHYTVYEFRDLLLDNTHCEDKTVLKLNIESDFTINSSTYVPFYSFIPFEKVVLEAPSATSPKQITFNYQCSRASQCTNGYKISAFKIMTGKEVEINHIDLIHSLDASVLGETESSVNFTGIEVTAGTKIMADNLRIQSYTDVNKNDFRWHKGIRLTTNSSLYCESCQVQGDWIGVEGYSANVMLKSEKPGNTGLITSEGYGVFISGLGSLVTSKGQISAPSIFNAGSYSRIFSFQSSLDITGNTAVLPVYGFNFQSKNIPATYPTYPYALTIYGGNVMGLPTQNIDQFTFAGFSSSDGSSRVYVHPLTQFFVQGIDGHDAQRTTDYNTYLSCEGVGLLQMGGTFFCN